LSELQPQTSLPIFKDLRISTHDPSLLLQWSCCSDMKRVESFIRLIWEDTRLFDISCVCIPLETGRCGAAQTGTQIASPFSTKSQGVNLHPSQQGVPLKTLVGGMP
jgi:hypothetical protein